MTDQQTSRPVPPRDASPDGHNRRIPPLVWIIVAALIAWFAYFAIQSRRPDVHMGTDSALPSERVPAAATATPSSTGVRPGVDGQR